MTMDLLDLYQQASEWTVGKVAGTKDLDATTPCDEWDVRTLMNHMLETQNYFATTASGGQASPPSPHPPELLGDDPAADFERARTKTIEAFDQPGVIEKTGPSLGHRRRRPAAPRLGSCPCNGPGHDHARRVGRRGLRDDPRPFHRG